MAAYAFDRSSSLLSQRRGYGAEMSNERLWGSIASTFPLLVKSNTMLFAEQIFRFNFGYEWSSALAEKMAQHEVTIRAKLSVAQDVIALGLPDLEVTRDFFETVCDVVKAWCLEIAARLPMDGPHAQYYVGELTPYHGFGAQVVDNSVARAVWLQSFGLEARPNGPWEPPSPVARSLVRKARTPVRTAEFRFCILLTS